MEKYELLKDLGAGNFGVARLMRNKETKELVAMKYIPRGQKVLDLWIKSDSFNSNRVLLSHFWYRFRTDWWECSEGDHQPQVAEASEYNPVQRGVYFGSFNFNAVWLIDNRTCLQSIWLILFPFILISLQVVLTPTHLAIVMEYASGGELFDRICNAGRFSEDEVILELPSIAIRWVFFLNSKKSPFLLWKLGEILLPAIDMWCQLLPFPGTRNTIFLLRANIEIFYFLPFLCHLNMSSIL
jgi:serine/threonine protein kinase